jgi:chaperonin GroES
MIGRIKPLQDKILIKKIKKDKTEGGIYLSDISISAPQTGMVMAVGPGKIKDGMLITPTVQVGDEVYFGAYSGLCSDEDYLIIREEEILGIVK